MGGFRQLATLISLSALALAGCASTDRSSDPVFGIKTGAWDVTSILDEDASRPSPETWARMTPEMREIYEQGVRLRAARPRSPDKECVEKADLAAHVFAGQFSAPGRPIPDKACSAKVLISDVRHHSVEVICPPGSAYLARRVLELEADSDVAVHGKFTGYMSDGRGTAVFDVVGRWQGPECKRPAAP